MDMEPPFIRNTGPLDHSRSWRSLVRTGQLPDHLGYHEAAPFGDMMLTGAFGLVEGAMMQETQKVRRGPQLLTGASAT